MEADFWHRCWQRNTTGFHQETLHPFLIQYIKPRLLPSDKHVFVPLCGKSLDMVWLAEHMQVTGIELSEIACRDFFVEKSIDYQTVAQPPFIGYGYENITLWQGDFFKFGLSEHADIVYDRAALIALPKAMQNDYAEHLKRFIEQGTRLFLIALEFPEQEMSGPPFPIFKADIDTLFSGMRVEKLASHELTDKRFAQRVFNVSSLVETLYLIQK